MKTFLLTIEAAQLINRLEAKLKQANNLADILRITAIIRDAENRTDRRLKNWRKIKK